MNKTIQERINGNIASALQKWGNMSALSRKWLIVFVISALLFTVNVIKIANLNARNEQVRVQKAALITEVEYQNSPRVVIPSLLKSFFDGFTLGAFSKEGLFEEHYKRERWADSTAEKGARIWAEGDFLTEKISSFAFWRNIFAIVMIVSFIGYKITSKRNDARCWRVLTAILAKTKTALNQIKTKMRAQKGD